MANKVLIITGWFLLGSMAAFSQSGSRPATTEFGESDIAAIEEMYYHYEVAFFSNDYATLREILAGPFLTAVRGDERWEVVETAAEQRRDSLKELQKRGYSHADITQRRIMPLTADRALLYQTYRRWRKDGTSMNEDGASIYIACKSSGVWKLCGMLPLELKYFGKEYRTTPPPTPLEEARRQKGTR